jgi:hypothetical protein
MTAQIKGNWEMRDPGHNGMHTLSGDKPTNPSALVVKAAFS